MRATFNGVLFLVISALFTGNTQAEHSLSVDIKCGVEDYLDTQMYLKETYSSSPKARRYLGFLSAFGSNGRIRYDLAVEAETSKAGRRKDLRLCQISLYATDSKGEERAAFFGDRTEPCLPLSFDNAVTIGALAPKPKPGEFRYIRGCEFAHFQEISPTK